MAGIYRQRHPEHTVFYRVFFYCFERFLREYEDRFEKEYGYFRPVIQVVFTVPKMLRLFFRFRRKLLNDLCLSAVRALLKFFHTATGLELMPGVVAVIQTFGDRINFHPHIHVLVTEGGTAPDGAFHRVCRFHDEVIQEIFTHEVFSLLLRKTLIGLPLVQKILRWRHTGFNVHSKVRVQTKGEAVRVGKYMIRPLLSLKRLFFDETAGVEARCQLSLS